MSSRTLPAVLGIFAVAFSPPAPGSAQEAPPEVGDHVRAAWTDSNWEGEHLAVRTLDEFTGGETYGWLLPRGPDFFWLGEVRNGAVFDIEVDILFETVRAEDGSVVGMDLLWGPDELWYQVRRGGDDRSDQS